jgi:hypothetical protein
MSVSYPNFDEIPLSIVVVVAVAKVKQDFDMALLYKSIVRTPYEIIKKTRGRKKKDYVAPVQITPPAGSIVFKRFGDKQEGPQIKAGSSPFRNCVEIYISIGEKLVNVKISASHFQITGCKNLEQADQTILILTGILKSLNENPKNKPFLLSEQICSDYEKQIGMLRKDYKIGWRVNRKAFYRLLRILPFAYPDYDPIWNPGVTLKLNLGVSKGASIKNKNNDQTLITYNTGSIMQVGKDLERMKKAFVIYMTILLKFRYLIEDK